jgi:hypothetical protein
MQKMSWQYKASCCGKKSLPTPVQKTLLSRASCCHYQHFQVKHQASFVLEKQAVIFDSGVNPTEISFDFSIYSFSVDVPLDTPRQQILLPSVRRALLQIYRI